MRALVVHASRSGSTQEIAERIAETLRHSGFEAVTQSAAKADSPADYDFVVIGSAVYFNRWMRPAKQFVRKHQKILLNRPVWLFSSGPIGTEKKDAQGRDLCTVLVPKEIPEFRRAIRPKSHRVFFGAMDPGKLKFPLSLLLKLPANEGNAVFPLGDFRDWNDVEAWADSIAKAMTASNVSVA